MLSVGRFYAPEIRVENGASIGGMSINEEFHNTLGKRVKLLREYLGLTQVEVREEAIRRGQGFGQSYLSDIENNHKFPGGEIVAVLADILGTTADYLLLRSDVPFPANEEQEQSYLTPEAEQVATIVDEIRNERRRRELIRMAETLLDEDRAQRASAQTNDEDHVLRSFLRFQQSRLSDKDFRRLLDEWRRWLDDLEQTGTEQ